MAIPDLLLSLTQLHSKCFRSTTGEHRARPSLPASRECRLVLNVDNPIGVLQLFPKAYAGCKLPKKSGLVAAVPAALAGRGCEYGWRALVCLVRNKNFLPFFSGIQVPTISLQGPSSRCHRQLTSVPSACIALYHVRHFVVVYSVYRTCSARNERPGVGGLKTQRQGETLRAPTCSWALGAAPNASDHCRELSAPARLAVLPSRLPPAAAHVSCPAPLARPSAPAPCRWWRPPTRPASWSLP
jgi:hypothetical protein